MEENSKGQQKRFLFGKLNKNTPNTLKPTNEETVITKKMGDNVEAPISALESFELLRVRSFRGLTKISKNCKQKSFTSSQFVPTLFQTATQALGKPIEPNLSQFNQQEERPQKQPHVVMQKIKPLIQKPPPQIESDDEDEDFLASIDNDELKALEKELFSRKKKLQTANAEAQDQPPQKKKQKWQPPKNLQPRKDFSTLAKNISLTNSIKKPLQNKRTQPFRAHRLSIDPSKLTKKKATNFMKKKTPQIQKQRRSSSFKPPTMKKPSKIQTPNSFSLKKMKDFKPPSSQKKKFTPQNQKFKIPLKKTPSSANTTPQFGSRKSITPSSSTRQFGSRKSFTPSPNLSTKAKSSTPLFGSRKSFTPSPSPLSQNKVFTPQNKILPKFKSQLKNKFGKSKTTPTNFSKTKTTPTNFSSKTNVTPTYRTPSNGGKDFSKRTPTPRFSKKKFTGQKKLIFPKNNSQKKRSLTPFPSNKKPKFGTRRFSNSKPAVPKFDDETPIKNQQTSSTTPIIKNEKKIVDSTAKIETINEGESKKLIFRKKRKSNEVENSSNNLEKTKEEKNNVRAEEQNSNNTTNKNNISSSSEVENNFKKNKENNTINKQNNINIEVEKIDQKEEEQEQEKKQLQKEKVSIIEKNKKNDLNGDHILMKKGAEQSEEEEDLFCGVFDSNSSEDEKKVLTLKKVAKEKGEKRTIAEVEENNLDSKKQPDKKKQKI